MTQFMVTNCIYNPMRLSYARFTSCSYCIFIILIIIMILLLPLHSVKDFFCRFSPFDLEWLHIWISRLCSLFSCSEMLKNVTEENIISDFTPFWRISSCFVNHLVIHLRSVYLHWRMGTGPFHHGPDILCMCWRPWAGTFFLSFPALQKFIGSSKFTTHCTNDPENTNDFDQLTFTVAQIYHNYCHVCP